MKMRKFLESEKCQSKATYAGFSEKKEKNYYNGIVLRELFKTHGLSYTRKDIVDLVKKVVPLELFQTNRELVINSTVLVLRLLRLQEYQNTYGILPGMKVHAGGSVYMTSSNIEVDYSYILEHGDYITIKKVKNKKCDLKKNGKDVFTRIGDSMELFLLQLAGEKLFPNKMVQASIVFLRHPKDDRETLVDASEFYCNDTFVTNFFSATKRVEMMNRIDAIVAGTPLHTCQNCESCSYSALCGYVKNNTNIAKIPAKAKASGTVRFTSAQNRLINVDTGICRVLAGAGSGKTTCIAKRICSLIEKGSRPSDILLITYTTKGAEEMKEKIAYWLAQSKITGVNVNDFTICTFNSFGHELLKKEYTRFGFTDTPKLMDRAENVALIKYILDNNPELPHFDYANPLLNMPYAKGVVLEMDKYFEKIKKAGCVYPSDVQTTLKMKESLAVEVLKYYQQYRKFIKDNNYIDYDDQINYGLAILNDDDCLKKYGYRHVIVDEFQDSDNLQIHILERLVQYKYFASLMVVGDDSQAIYSFRGATARNIIDFDEIFPSSFDIKLVKNFRSTEEICDVANKLNDINKDKVDKKLVAQKSGAVPKLFAVKSVEEYVNKMMNVISYYGLPFSDVALICSTKKELLAAQQELTRLNVPSVIAVSELLIDNKVVQHLINFARFLVDPSADLYFAEFLQVYDNDTFKKMQAGPGFYTWVEQEKTKFIDTLDAFTTEADKIEYIYSLFEKIAAEERAVRCLIDTLQKRTFPMLSNLCNFLIEMELYQAEYCVEKFEDQVDAITLTTAHSSKGREWDCVFVYLDGFKYPRVTFYNQEKNLPAYEEVRRVLFVAVTRAKELLFMGGDSSHCAYKEINGILHPVPKYTF